MECLFIQTPDPDCLLTFLGCECILPLSNSIFHPNVDSDFAAPGSTAFSKQQCSNKVKKSSYKGKLQPSIRNTFEKTLNYPNFERWSVKSRRGDRDALYLAFKLLFGKETMS